MSSRCWLLSGESSGDEQSRFAQQRVPHVFTPGGALQVQRKRRTAVVGTHVSVICKKEAAYDETKWFMGTSEAKLVEAASSYIVQGLLFNMQGWKGPFALLLILA